MRQRKLLPLNLQFFSEEPTDNPSEETQITDIVEEQPENKIPYDRFKQKVDEANELKRRLAELEKAKEDGERKKLEEQNEFKTLYEKAQAELAELQSKAAEAQLETLRTNLLVNAGYTGEQLERVRKYIVGADEDALKASLEELKQDIPPKSGGVDPQVGNNPKQPPQPKDLTEEGKSAYQRLKALGKIRR